MIRKTRKQFLDIIFFASLAGFLILIVCMILGTVILSTSYPSEIDIPPLLKIVADVGGSIFLLGSLGLWIHSVWVTIELSRTNEAEGLRIFLVIVGSFFAAYLFYFLDRRKLT